MKDICACSRCQKELKDFRIEIEFHTTVDRMREDSSWEFIPNLDNSSREIICLDCFNEFTDLMASLNKKYVPEVK